MPPLVLIVAYDASDAVWNVRIKGYPQYMVFQFERIDTLVALMEAADHAAPHSAGHVRYELSCVTVAPHPQAWQELVESGLTRAMGPAQ
jgi:hypothetical protein